MATRTDRKMSEVTIPKTPLRPGKSTLKEKQDKELELKFDFS
jgi:hypothetical protein